MERIVITEFVTLDGVFDMFEDNSGAEGRERGSWSFQLDSGEDGAAFKLQEMRDTAALLLGRVTYEVFARSWPSETGELADLLNAKPKYVVSSTLENPGWNTHVLDGNPVERIAKLKGDGRADGVLLVTYRPADDGEGGRGGVTRELRCTRDRERPADAWISDEGLAVSRSPTSVAERKECRGAQG